MSLFSDLLTVYAKRAGANSPQIASFCGMDRVTVYRFMKGKTLPKDKKTVSGMAEFLQLTRDERRTLEEAYEYSRLGAHVYWQRKYIQSFMRSFSGKARALIPSFQYDTEEVEELPAETRIVSGTDSVIRRIQKEILAEREKTAGRIELVMRPGTGPVMDKIGRASCRERV